MMFQLACLCLLVVSFSYVDAASTSGRKICSGDWLKGFVEDGEEGCCLPEGECDDPQLNLKFAEEIRLLSAYKSPGRRKRSVGSFPVMDPGFSIRHYKMNKNTEPPEADSSELMLNMNEFQESPPKDPQTCPAGCSSNTKAVCSSKLKLSFPLFGTSVTKKQKVHIIQAGSWFDQPVVRRICRHRWCSLVRGSCRQMVQPQLMFVVPEGSGAAGFGLDYVYVESGCECTLHLGGRNASTSDSSRESAEILSSLESEEEEMEEGEEDEELARHAAEEEEELVPKSAEEEELVPQSNPEEEILPNLELQPQWEEEINSSPEEVVETSQEEEIETNLEEETREEATEDESPIATQPPVPDQPTPQPAIEEETTQNGATTTSSWWKLPGGGY